MKNDNTDEKISQRLTRAEAGRMMSVHPRSIDRLVSKGTLKRGTDGRFDANDLRALGEELEETEQTEKTKETGEREDVLVRALKQSLDHNERMLKAYEGHHARLLDAGERQMAQMLGQFEKMQATVQAAWDAIGDMAMRKAESEEAAATRLERLEIIKSTGRSVEKWLPKLLDQIADLRGLKSFIERLDPDERKALWGIVGAFEYDGKMDKAKALGEMLTKAGVPRPEEPKTEEPANAAE